MTLDEPVRERLAELLECDPDWVALCAAALDRNQQRERMRQTIGELRAEVVRLKRELKESRHFIADLQHATGFRTPNDALRARGEGQ